MLEGRRVNLRVMEKEDVPLLVEWYNSLEFQGPFFPVLQKSKSQAVKEFENPSALQVAMGNVEFTIEKKDGTKIGHIGYGKDVLHEWTEIGYVLIPSERGKGYATEAIRILVDYLFLYKDIPRIMICTAAGNCASIKAAQKAGFKKEGLIRKGGFVAGEYVDLCLLGILREEWKEPNMLRRKSMSKR